MQQKRRGGESASEQVPTVVVSAANEPRKSLAARLKCGELWGHRAPKSVGAQQPQSDPWADQPHAIPVACSGTTIESNLLGEGALSGSDDNDSPRPWILNEY